MKAKLIKRLIFFLSPFILILIINLVVDPFNYYSLTSSIIKKDSVAIPLDYRLYKLNSFRKSPCKRIILGDSRMAALDVEVIDSLTNRKYFNFSYGGGTLEEVVKSIEFAKKYTKLEEIVIGINFNLFDASNSRERISRAVKTINKPSSYFFSYQTTKASLYVLTYNLSGKNLASENPGITKNEFWKQQLNTANITYGSYRYPKHFEQSLTELNNYCKKNSIELKIIIPPTHTELQNIVDASQLRNEYKMYKEFLGKIGKNYDFDFPNSITIDSSNFKDPYHFNEIIMKKIINCVWGQDSIKNIFIPLNQNESNN